MQSLYHCPIFFVVALPLLPEGIKCALASLELLAVIGSGWIARRFVQWHGFTCSALEKGGSSEYSLGDAAEYLAFAAALLGGDVEATPPLTMCFFLADRRLKSEKRRNT